MTTTNDAQSNQRGSQGLEAGASTREDGGDVDRTSQVRPVPESDRQPGVVPPVGVGAGEPVSMPTVATCVECGLPIEDEEFWFWDDDETQPIHKSCHSARAQRESE